MSFDSLYARYLQAFPDRPGVDEFVGYAFQMTCDGTYLEVAHIEGCDDLTDDLGFTYLDLSFVCDQHPEIFMQLAEDYMFP